MTTKVGVLVTSPIPSTVGDATIEVSVASGVNVVTTVTSVVGVEVISRVGVSVRSAVGAVSMEGVKVTSGVMDGVTSTIGMTVGVAQILLYLAIRVELPFSRLTLPTAQILSAATDARA